MATTNNRGDTEKDLFAAVEQQDFKTILKHIKNGINIKKKNLHGFNPLHMAAQMGNSRLIDLCLAKGVGIHSLTKCRRTALYISVEQQHMDIVKQLLKYGAKINTMNSDWNTPLNEAIRLGNLDLVRLLIDHGADPKFGSTPLIPALEIFHVPLINYLLKHGAKAEDKNIKGDGLLHIAIQATSDPATRYKVVKALLAHGASIMKRNADKATPLHLTLHRGDVQLADLLIRSGANIYAKDSRNRSILQIAVIRNLHEVVLKLLAMGANPNDYDCECNGILANAIHLKNEQMVRTLLVYGADPTTNGAVHVAAERGYEGIMKILVDNGADINYKTQRELITPLYRAIEFGHAIMVWYLLGLDANINTTNLSNLPLRKAITLFNAESTNKIFHLILLIMIMHIALLVARDEYVHQENIQLICKQSNLSKCFDIHYKELMEMKNTKVKGTNVLYFDLLSMPQHALIDCLRSTPVLEEIRRFDYKLLFPSYAAKFTARFSEATQILESLYPPSSSPYSI